MGSLSLSSPKAVKAPSSPLRRQDVCIIVPRKERWEHGGFQDEMVNLMAELSPSSSLGSPKSTMSSYNSLMPQEDIVDQPSPRRMSTMMKAKKLAEFKQRRYAEMEKEKMKATEFFLDYKAKQAEESHPLLNRRGVQLWRKMGRSEKSFGRKGDTSRSPSRSAGLLAPLTYKEHDALDTQETPEDKERRRKELLAKLGETIREGRVSKEDLLQYQTNLRKSSSSRKSPMKSPIQVLPNKEDLPREPVGWCQCHKTSTSSHGRHLFDAIRSGLLDHVGELLEKVDVNVMNSRRRTALHIAVSVNQVDIVKHLVLNGADISSVDENLETPLAAACRKNFQEIALFLVNASSGKYLNIPDRLGRRALILAADNGNATLVEALLKAGANPLVYDKDGRTSLCYCAMRNHSHVAELLCAASRAYSLKHNPTTPESHWRENFLERRDTSGNTSLFYAAKNGHKETASIIIANGADPWRPNRTGETPLLYAHWLRQEDFPFDPRHIERRFFN